MGWSRNWGEGKKGTSAILLTIKINKIKIKFYLETIKTLSFKNVSNCGIFLDFDLEASGALEE